MTGTDKRYGRYRLLRKLGSGSMGDVLLARAEGPEGFARLCAVKRVRGTHAEDPVYVKMFIDEARLVGQLSHPGIIQIFELGREREGWFLAMEYVHGKSLRALQRALLHRGLTLSPELAAYLATRILAALAYVHDAKGQDGTPLRLIHRDVKPENVLLSFHGDVKLADFGIARSAQTPGLTQTGAIRGTLPYVTPEQISAGAVTPLIDVWAVGVTLYELLAGERPFRGKGDFETARSILRDTPAPLTAKNPTVSPMLASVVDRALQKDPALRYQTAREMAAALEPLLIAANGRPVTDADVARVLRETFPDEPDSPLVERIGEPIQEDDSLEVMVVGLPSDGGAVPATPGPPKALDAETRSDRPLPKPQSRLALAIGALAVAVATGIAVSFALQKPPAPVPPGPPVTAADADAGAAPSRTVEPETPPHPTLEPDAGAPAAPPDAGAPAPSPDAVRAVAKAGFGTVDVLARPYAEVSWRGGKLGVTPLFGVKLPVGEQTLTLVNPELKLEKKVKVRVAAGASRRVTVDLEAR